MTDVDRHAQWERWLETITSEVQDLVVNRHIFLRVREIVAANPRIQQPSAFYEFMAVTYAASSVMVVRRQIDLDERSVSLLRLLYDIRRYPNILSRERHVARYLQQGLDADLGNREFDRIAGAGAPRLDVRHVQPDIDRLRDATAGLGHFASIRVAHLDETAPTITPTFDDLHHAVGVLEDLIRRYRVIVSCVGGEVMPVFVHPWEAIFRHQWMP